jgi:hypothetical protein
MFLFFRASAYAMGPPNLVYTSIVKFFVDMRVYLHSATVSHGVMPN